MLLPHNFLIPRFICPTGKAGSIMFHLYKCRDREEAAEGFCDLVGMLTVTASPVQVSGYEAVWRLRHLG